MRACGRAVRRVEMRLFQFFLSRLFISKNEKEMIIYRERERRKKRTKSNV